jgi:Questin oxidase-like
LKHSLSGQAFVAAASQLPTKIVKFDFFLIHGLTSCHHLLVLLDQPWISEANKARLVAYSGRLLAAVYPVVGIPKLHLNEITDYVPKHPDDGSWNQLVKRALEVPDDGHTSKVIRALMHGQKVCQPFEDKDSFMVRGDMWQKIAHMCKSLPKMYLRTLTSFPIGLDSVEDAEIRWVRMCGFKEAWEAFPERHA